MSTAAAGGTGSDGAPAASVSTHILDTSVGLPAADVAVELSVRDVRDGGDWRSRGGSRTDADGRCKDLPALPEGTTHVRLDFAVEPYLAAKPAQHDRSARTTDRSRPAEEQQDAPRARDSGAFFPEVTVTFAVEPGEHYHVPLLLNPFGYSVYRGS